MDRTSEEIKKGLECCRESQDCTQDNIPKCPYYEKETCLIELVDDALALIQQKERENAEQAERIRVLENQFREAVKMAQQLEARVQDRDREKVALLHLCEQFGQCVICKHTDKGMNESPCCDCLYCNMDATGSHWQWRGIQKEDSDA